MSPGEWKCPVINVYDFHFKGWVILLWRLRHPILWWKYRCRVYRGLPAQEGLSDWKPIDPKRAGPGTCSFSPDSFVPYDPIEWDMSQIINGVCYPRMSCRSEMEAKRKATKQPRDKGDQVTKLRRVIDTWGAFFGPSAEFNYAGQVLLFPLLLVVCVVGSLCDLLFLRR